MILPWGGPVSLTKLRTLEPPPVSNDSDVAERGHQRGPEFPHGKVNT